MIYAVVKLLLIVYLAVPKANGVEKIENNFNAYVVKVKVLFDSKY